LSTSSISLPLPLPSSSYVLLRCFSFCSFLEALVLRKPAIIQQDQPSQGAFARCLASLSTRSTRAPSNIINNFLSSACNGLPGHGIAHLPWPAISM
ncbi:hypothetical protein IWX47DRAFT_571537, partial [Phyllosticta citricarpa]